MFPDALKAVIVQKEMNYAVEMILIFQVGFIKSNQKKIIKISSVRLEFWYDGYLPFAVSGKLIAK